MREYSTHEWGDALWGVSVNHPEVRRVELLKEVQGVREVAVLRRTNLKAFAWIKVEVARGRLRDMFKEYGRGDDPVVDVVLDKLEGVVVDSDGGVKKEMSWEDL